MKSFFQLLAACFFATFAHGKDAPMTAEQLLDGCDAVIALSEGKKLDPERMVSASAASSYLDGYVDAVAMMQAANPLFRPVDLPKDGPELLAYVREVARFIRSNPKIREDASARVAVLLALKQFHPAK